MIRAIFPAVLMTACVSMPTPGDFGAVDRSPTPGAITPTDQDGDGLEDSEEQRLASAYLPFLSVPPGDHCPTSGLVVRVTPAERAGQVRLRYAWLFDRVCAPVESEGGAGSFAML